VILSLPLEISKEIFPFLPTSGLWETEGSRISIIDIGRITILLVAGIWAVNARSDWKDYLTKSNLLLPIVLLFGLYLLSLSYAINFGSGIREIIRFTFNMSFFMLIPLLVRDRKTFNWCLYTLIATGLLLGLLGIYQKFVGTYFFLWNPKLLLETSTRVNATFANPNFFARFLNISILMCIALLFGPRTHKIRLLLMATIAIDSLTVLFTNSRNGWVTLAAVLPLTLLMLPIRHSYKIGLIAAGGVGLLSIILAASVFSDVLAERFETFELGLRAIGERYYLIQGGWQMFIEHPWTGVGIGGFIYALGDPYLHMVWWQDGYLALPSHTAFVTLLAELGALSMVIVGFLMYRVARLALSLYQQGQHNDKLAVLGLSSMLLVILLSSQVEGRLFEDPYLWLAFGLLASLQIILKRDRQTEAGADATAAAMAAGR
jgi:O-antigen ligase